MSTLKSKYSPYPDNNLDLKSAVIAFDAGIRWHIIPINVMNKYPIIYDKINDESNKDIDVSITRCPYSGTVVIYEGIFTVDGKNKNNITLKKDDYIVQQINGECITGKCLIRRWEGYVMTLKDVLHELTDCEYLDYKKDDVDNDISNTSKQIVGLSYDSSDIDKGVKYIALISNDFNKIKEYISKYNIKMTKKNTFMIPTNLETWLDFYPNSKQIEI